MTTSTVSTVPTIGQLAPDQHRSLAARLVLGRVGSARWERPSFLALLVVTGILYVYNLAASGWANSFYSAAVQAGATNWEAFFFGSSDAGNSITVDKPPASLWLMDLSVRVFGLSSWSILLPEALMGVATVGVLYAIVRRRFSAGTALIAGGVLAITPVAALMFRFNNPDALLVLLTTLAVYFTVRGVETGKLKWVVLAGVMIGFGFLTKQLQAFLILPVLAGVYLYAAPGKFIRRLWHSLAAFGAVVVSAGWWVAVVELVPASMRPYIGGSQTNSFLELTFGYNGLGRVDGNETGSVTGGGGSTTGGNVGMWGATGITRLFANDIGGQIAWLIPTALVLAVVAFILIGRAPRVNAKRAMLIAFSGWLVVTGLVFSFMGGIFHAYYTVALAPAVAGLVAIGANMIWQKRAELWARIVMAVVLFGTAVWSYELLDRATDWLPWLKFVVLALGIVGGGLLIVPPIRRALTVATIVAALSAALLGPLAYTIQTVTTAHTGSIVTAGPTVAGAQGGFGGGGFGGAAGGRPNFGGGQGAAGFGGQPPTGAGQAGAGQAGAGQAGVGQAVTAPTGFGGVRAAGGFGGAGGLLNSATVGTQVATLLKADASSYTWVAAAIGSNTAAGYQLATQESVMPIGGFNGSDPSPTLAEFEADVAAGKIHYFIGGSVGASNGGSNASSQISSWVSAHFTAQTIHGVTLYDLTARTN